MTEALIGPCDSALSVSLNWLRYCPDTTYTRQFLWCSFGPATERADCHAASSTNRLTCAVWLVARCLSMPCTYACMHLGRKRLPTPARKFRCDILSETKELNVPDTGRLWHTECSCLSKHAHQMTTVMHGIQALERQSCGHREQLSGQLLCDFMKCSPIRHPHAG